MFYYIFRAKTVREFNYISGENQGKFREKSGDFIIKSLWRPDDVE